VAPTRGRTATHKPPALFLTNIGQLLTLRGEPGPRRGHQLTQLEIIEDAAVLCIAGKIVSAGSRRDAASDSWLKNNRKHLREIDCRRGVVIPGFVDSHTHPAFTAPRLVDFEKRIAGASYEEIADAGGGIRSSIEGVRRTAKQSLADSVLAAFQRMARQGTTTVEAKSGYGLSLESEVKSLEAIRSAGERWPGTVIPTLLAAHVVPPEYQDRRSDYLQLVIAQLIPLVARRRLAQFVDVFCERGAFTLEEADQIFRAAQQHELGIRAHVCQLTPAALGPLHRFRPASLDHLDHVRNEDLESFEQSATVATLLPGANHFLGLHHYPPARRLIDAGAAVALATDYNPGTSPTVSMPFVLSLACTQMKMSPAEAITAAAINGACALHLEGRKGSIESGKDADLAIFAVRDYREIAYWFATDMCSGVVMQGEYLNWIC